MALSPEQRWLQKLTVQLKGSHMSKWRGHESRQHLAKTASFVIAVDFIAYVVKGL